MPMFVVTGEETLIGLELSRVVDGRVGDADKVSILEDFDCPDRKGQSRGDADIRAWMAPIVDALTTAGLFADRRIVVVRNVQNLEPLAVDILAQALELRLEEFDVVLTSTTKLGKRLGDIAKAAKAEMISAVAVTKAGERIERVEAALVEAGFSYSPEVARLIATWFGGDQARIAGLVATLQSAYGEGAKLSRSDIEAFLGEAGSVPPWDFTDAIDAGDVAKSLDMLHRMMGPGGSHPLQLLSLLSNRYAQMMKLDGRDVRSVEDASAVLGGKGFTIEKLLKQYQRLGSAGISKAITRIAEADADLRGRIDWEPEWVMEVLVARLAALAGPVRQREGLRKARRQ